MSTQLMTQNHHYHHHHHNHHNNHHPNSILECKSKYDAEFRRFGLNRFTYTKFDEFYSLLERLHGLVDIPFNIYYTDKDGELLPINNDNNLARVLQVTVGVLRLIIFRRGECYPEQSAGGVVGGGNTLTLGGSGMSVHSSGPYSSSGGLLNYSNINSVNASITPSYRAANLINHIKELSTTLTSSSSQSSAKPFVISYPADFRPVSAIIDVDILPESYRRVRLHKHKSSKPLGFYIRDGRSLRVTPNGVEQVPGIFISRLMPGGLAESTGLLSVNDEVIEVNGIEVSGKTLDQVTDMMVANSSNLIITVKPTNQKYNLNRSMNQSASSVMIPGGVKSSSTAIGLMNTSTMSAGSSMRGNHHSRGDVSKLSAKSNDAVVVHHHGAVANSTMNANNTTTNNGSSMTSSSSVNSSFSSSNQPVNRHSFKTNGSTKANAPLKPSSISATDTDQIKLDLKTDKNGDEIEDEEEEEEDDDDDDDDEEIHDATTGGTHHHHHHHHHRSASPDNSNSDDKILTL